MQPAELAQLLQSKPSPEQLQQVLLQNLIDNSRQPETSAIDDDARQLHRCRTRLRAAQARLQHVAAALGACACFGDARCPQCRGAGAPGTRAPDSEAFALFVEPALRQLGLLVDDQIVPNPEG